MTLNRRAFLRQAGVGAAGLGLLSLVPACRTTPQTAGTGKLPRSTPEAEGVSSAGILAFLEAVRQSKHEMHSFMLVRHGRVVAEGWWSPYGPEFNHTLYSMSKSFTSTAVGFAVAEGRLRVDDRVVSFFPNDLPEKVSDHLAALRVKDLLTMSVGNDKDPTWPMVEEQNWVKAFLASPITHPPGSTFMYNSGATYMLLGHRPAGHRAEDPRLPAAAAVRAAWHRRHDLGDLSARHQRRRLGPEHSEPRASRSSGSCICKGRLARPADPARAQWVEEATTFKIQQPLPAKPSRPNEQNDWLQGYCYQFWRCRHNAFRGDGAFGQFMIVMPEQDAVIAITAKPATCKASWTWSGSICCRR